MYTKNKKVRLNRALIIFCLLANAIIITVAYTNTHRIHWILVVLIPLLAIAIYKVSWAVEVVRNYFLNRRNVFASRNYMQWFPHLMYPNKISEADMYILIGNDQCSQPYRASILNMRSDKPASRKLHKILNDVPLVNSGDSSGSKITCYHLHPGGGVLQVNPTEVWYLNEAGRFNNARFKQVARKPEVKMIELTLSLSIRSLNSVFSLSDIGPGTNDVEDPLTTDTRFGLFSDAEGILHSLDSLRELSGGKPVGLKFYGITKRDVHEIFHAIRKTEIKPDFIAIEEHDHAPGLRESNLHDGKTGVLAAMSLYELLLFVSQTLHIYGLNRDIKTIAIGKITNSLDMLKLFALGANVVNTDMSNFNVAKYSEQGPTIARLYKREDVNDFHKGLIRDTIQMMKACGFKSVSDFTLSNFFSKLDVLYSKSFSEPGASIFNPVFESENRDFKTRFFKKEGLVKQNYSYQ